MNPQNLWRHIQNFNLQEFAASIPSAFIGFLLSLSILEFFIGSFLTFMFIMIQVVGFVSYHRFKRGRKKAFYLNKIDADGNYGGLM